MAWQEVTDPKIIEDVLPKFETEESAPTEGGWQDVDVESLDPKELERLQFDLPSFEGPEPPWAVVRGLKGGWSGLKSIYGGLVAAVGDDLGIPDMQEYGIGLFRQYQEEAAQRFGYNPTLEQVFQSDEMLADFGTWLGIAGGQAVATSVPIMLSFLVNPALGYAATYSMGVGETYGAQLEETEDPRAYWAFAAGVPYVVAERLLGMGGRIGTMLREGGGEVSKKFSTRLAKEVVKTPAEEAVAEFTQEGLGIGAAGLEAGKTSLAEIYTPEKRKEMYEAAAKGAAGGMVFAPLAAAPGPSKKPGDEDEEPPGEQPPPEEEAAPGLDETGPQGPPQPPPQREAPPEAPEVPPEAEAPSVPPERAPGAVSEATGISEVAPPTLDELEEEAAAAEAATEIEAEAAKVEPAPTEAQKEAGNYRKGHVKLQDLDITIETPKGGIRSGKTEKGEPWEVEMPAHYGYIKRTTGADEEQVDVYLGDDAASPTVFVVDQIDPETGKFDEHKAILGTRDIDTAEELYRGGFSDGSGDARMGAITEMSMGEFQGWLESGQATEPFAYEEETPVETGVRAESAEVREPPPPPPGFEPVEPAPAEPPAGPRVIVNQIPGEELRTQTDLLGGPEVTERDMAMRERATTRLAEFEQQGLDPDDIADAIADEVEVAQDRVDIQPTPRAKFDLDVAREMKRQFEAERPQIPMKEPARPLEPDVAEGRVPIADDRQLQKEKTAKFNARREAYPNAQMNDLDAVLFHRGWDLHAEGAGRSSADRAQSQTGWDARENWIAETKKPSGRPRYTVKKAAIIPTREGVKAVPISEETKELPAEEPPAEAEAAPDTRDLSRQVQDRLPQGFKAKELQDLADQAFGGTLAEGAYTWKDAYDAVEIGVNRHLSQALRPAKTAEEAKAQVKEIEDILSKLPTQTRRTEEAEQFQQFSTPPSYGAVASYAADIKAGDVLLEPSAGTGSLAFFGNVYGAKETVTNELSERRADLLESLGLGRVFRENAEQLNNILPKDVKPTVIVMNPPFSETAGRLAKKDIMAGSKHVVQALKRLEPGGRLVAIVGRGMAPDKAKFKGWWDKLYSDYNVRANVGVPGKVFKKYGTTFDTRMLVIDKDGATDRKAIISRDVESLDELVDIAQEVRDARRMVEREPERAEPAGPGVSEEPEGAAERQPSVPAAARPVEPRAERPRAGEPARVPRERGERPAGERPERGAGVAPEGRPDTAVRAGEPEPAGGRPEGGEPGAREAAGARPELPAQVPGVESAAVEQREIEASEHELTDSLFENYKPQRLKIEGAQKHPGPLVQSAAMAGVAPPPPTYQPKLPKALITSGKLSEAQLETVVYAGQAHSEFLPHAEGETAVRRGFFIGDGTGVGKGREISGIIKDNQNQGRTKAVWLSASAKLHKDAQRDWSGIGGNQDEIFPLDKTKQDAKVKRDKGIMFTTYTMLGRKGKRQKGKDGGPDTFGPSRIDQIVNWLGEDFDGVIAFDEAHKMGNAIAVKGKRGLMKPSQQALAGVELQQRLPNARIVYVSATGATEVKNLSYAERLGLWGRGTPFATKLEFINEVSSGGIAAMELVARDAKALGGYIARSLSYDGIEYNRLTHKLTKQQRELYDTMAEGWQLVLRNIGAALEASGGNESGQARSAAMSAFWSAHQRFFNQVLTSLQMPSVLKAVEADVEAGNAVVLQLVNTNEAGLKRQMANVETEDDLETLDLTPRDALMGYIENSFPVHQYETYTDESGNERTRLVEDSAGNPVENAEAVAMRDELLDRLGALKVPFGPLELLFNHFGADKIAEVTGRSQRVYQADTPDGRKTIRETRPGSANFTEADAFQNDKKQILVFSDAGGTGRSYHADLTAKNQRKRIHYLLQPGWRADNAVQGFGRTHRSNQKQPPIYRLVTTDLKGQARFISSVARRLDQLGALTKGQRQAGAQGLFSERDNLESEYARDALRRLIRDIAADEVEGMTLGEFETETGLSLTDRETGGLKKDLPDIPQFLNRMLSLTVDRQNLVFEEFSKRLEQNIQLAVAKGTLDVGMETIKADKVTKVEDQTVYTDERTGAETKYVKLELAFKNKPRSFSDVVDKGIGLLGAEPESYLRSLKSGRIYVVVDGGTHTDSKTGNVTPQKRLVSPLTYEYIDSYRLNNREYWEPIGSRSEANKAWDEHVKTLPEYSTREEHLITGIVLPIWDRLRGKSRIYRVQTDQGERMIGRVIPASQVRPVLESLGATAAGPKLTPEQAVERIMHNDSLRLANGWRIRRRLVNQEQRIEIEGPSVQDMAQLKADGVFTERIQWATRFFVPTGDKAAAVLARVIEFRPIVEVLPPAGAEEGEGSAIRFSFDDEELSTDWVNQNAKIVERIQALAKRLVPTVDVTIAVKNVFTAFDELTPEEQTQALEMSGGPTGLWYAEKQLISVALNAKDPVKVLRHEAIHALRGMGLIRPGEWALLEQEAKRRWRTEYRVDERWTKESAEEKNEEAVAEAFRLWQGGHLFAPGFRRIFERISQFLRSLGNMLRGYGFTTVDRIFEKIETGEVGRRRPSSYRERVEAVRFHIEDEMSPSEAEHLRRMGTKIGAQPLTWKQRLSQMAGKNVARRIRQGMADDLDSFKFYEQLMNEGRLYEDARSAYKLARNSRGMTEWIVHAMADGVPVWKEGQFTINTAVKAPYQIIDAIGDERIEHFQTYMAARRAEELMAQGRERLFTEEEIEAGKKLGEVYPDFEEHWNDLQEHHRHVLDFVQQSGLFNQKTRDFLEDMHKNYVPFYRLMENDSGKPVAQADRARLGFNGQHPAFRKLKGGQQNIDQPLLNWERNVYRLLEMSVKNVVMLRTEQMNAGLGFSFMEPRSRIAKRGLTSVKQMVDALANQGIEITPEDNVDPDALELLWTFGHAPQGKNMVTWVRGGQVRFAQVTDPLMYRSITQVVRTPWPGWASVFTWPRHLLTKAVGLDPSFQMANIFRDTIHAAVVSKIGFRPGIDSLRGFWKVLSRDPQFREMMASGGALASLYEAERPRMAKKLKRKTARGTGKVITTGRDWVGFFERIESTPEYATRAGVFAKMLDDGKPLIEAVYQSRDVPTDFAMRGDHAVMRLFAETIPFFNARVQGLYRGGRGVAENPMNFAWKGALVASLAVALYMMFRDDERYQQLTEQQRDTYIHWWIGDQHYKAPIPFEVGVFFMTVPQRMTELALEGRGRRFAERMKWNFLEMFNFNLWPDQIQLVKPVAQIEKNWDDFREIPVVPRYLENVMPAEQYTPQTPNVLIRLGRELDVSPLKVDHLIHGYLGAMGGYLVSAADELYTTIDTEMPVKPAIPWQDYPVIRRFVGRKVPRSSIYLNELYEMKGEIDKINGSIQSMKQQGDARRLKYLIDENADKWVLRPVVDSIAKQVGRITRAQRLIRLNPTLSAEEKQKADDELQAAKLKVAEQIKPLIRHYEGLD